MLRILVATVLLCMAAGVLWTTLPSRKRLQGMLKKPTIRELLPVGLICTVFIGCIFAIVAMISG